MLCRKFKSILFTKTNKNVVYRPVIPSRSFSKWFEIISGPNVTTSSRFKIFRDIIFKRAFNVWTKSAILSNVVRRYRRERGVKDMLQYFRQMFFKRKTHLLVYGAACTRNTEEKPGRPPKKCAKDIKDAEMKRYISDLDGIEELSKTTLFCEGCDRRLIIDAKHTGIRYCECPDSKPAETSHDGWMPYMETSDVIIWRKEYKPGGLFAYKVYGRYKHINAQDFALIQVDSAYRPKWDDAVASIAEIEKHANGVHNQYIVHWEVLWPRLFANRDYVYIRRHKEYTVESHCLTHKDAIFPEGSPCVATERFERPSVHAHAKQASIEQDQKEQRENEIKNAPMIENKVYVIVSRSCRHPKAPEDTSVVRVTEYWSHMVVTSLHGPDKPGMEFVLTYYDEPAVGGMPTAITSWAMGRAGPAFMEKMRTAAEHYHSWKRSHAHKDTPDFSPEPVNVDHKVQSDTMDEADMESIDGKQSEEQEDSPEHTDVNDSPISKEQGTQTRPVNITLVAGPDDVIAGDDTMHIVSKVTITVKDKDPQDDIESENADEIEEFTEPEPSPIIKSLQSSIDSQKIVLEDVANKDPEAPILIMEQDTALDKDSISLEEKKKKRLKNDRKFKLCPPESTAV